MNTSNLTPPEDTESQLTRHPEEDFDADVQEVLCEVLETALITGDVNVVEDQTHFSSASEQILISELLVCNRELEKMKENMNDLQNRVINIIAILANI